MTDHLQDTLVSIVSNPFHHVNTEGVHQLIMGLSQNFSRCLRQPQNQVVTDEKHVIMKNAKSTLVNLI